MINLLENLKIPKEIEIDLKDINSTEDEIAIQKSIFTARDKKFNQEQAKKVLDEREKEALQVIEIPSSANDLIVVTKVKNLGAYIITITEKSPAKYRGVFVNRLQNYCLDALEELLQANFLIMDNIENKKRREKHQKDAIIKLKMLGYIAMLAEISSCILKRQYKQISIQLGSAVNLVVAWKKSDDERWRMK